MIHFLRGTLLESYPTHVVMEVQGIGYLVHVPISTFDKLPAPPSEIKLLTWLQVREDAHTLYGFATTDERDLFKLLIDHVTGIGPKMALSVLSGSSTTQFRTSVIQNDIAALSRIKGVGKKTAERILVELRDKVGVSDAWKTAAQSQPLTPVEQTRNDAVLALIALGYKQAEAQKVVTQLQTQNPAAATAELIRNALKLL